MGTSTDLIKFYGHSLASSDYSYFQAIFDEIDLYKSNVRLIFLYRPWIKDDGERISEIEARDGMCHKVFSITNNLRIYYGEQRSWEEPHAQIVARRQIERSTDLNLVSI